MGSVNLPLLCLSPSLLISVAFFLNVCLFLAFACSDLGFSPPEDASVSLGPQRGPETPQHLFNCPPSTGPLQPLDA